MQDTASHTTGPPALCNLYSNTCITQNIHHTHSVCEVTTWLRTLHFVVVYFGLCYNIQTYQERCTCIHICIYSSCIYHVNQPCTKPGVICIHIYGKFSIMLYLHLFVHEWFCPQYTQSVVCFGKVYTRCVFRVRL